VRGELKEMVALKEGFGNQVSWDSEIIGGDNVAEQQRD
jgi:hypothetical protein